MTIIITITIIIIKADFLVRLYIITRSIYRQKITPKVIIIVIIVNIIIFSIIFITVISVNPVICKETL